MIMGSNEDNVMFGNAPKKRTGFKINAGKKAFLVLSEKLYKDKAEAVLRELSCNAVDIHCEIGKADVKFTVTLPSSIYPWFVLRDFGTGLSPEQIEEIFTVYFASTKDNSNDSIGGFGLGCKSPFAYSESGGGFTVKSYQKGICTVYNMYMDDGEPYSTAMSITPTKEPDGLEILVPIPEHEHARWKTLARKVYRAFDRCKPYITNMDESTIDKFPDSDNFFFADDFGKSGDVYAVIGGVVYPIPSRLLTADMVFRYAGRPAYIKCPIGSVDVAPSREELSLTKEGEDYLVERMVKFSQDFAKEIKKEFDGITDSREAVTKATKYNSYVMNAISDLEINGEKIGDLIRRYTNMSYMSDYTVYSLRNGSVRQHVTKTGYCWRKNNIDAKDVFGIHRRKVHVLINDTGEGDLNMVKAYHHHIDDTVPVVVMHKTRHLNKTKYAEYGKNMKHICEKFAPTERTIMKFSEMVNIRKEYAVHKRKSAPVREQKPNVYRHYVDDIGLVQVQPMCLLTSEIRELEGIAVISYMDTFDRLVKKPSSRMVRSAPSRLFDLGAQEVYVIDNGKRGPATNSPKLKCGFKWAYDKKLSEFPSFNVLSGECPDVNEYDEALRLKKMGVFTLELTENFDNQNDEFIAEASDWVEPGNPDFAEFEQIKGDIDQINTEYSEKFCEHIRDISQKYPLLYAVANSDIELNDEIMKDIEILRAQ